MTTISDILKYIERAAPAAGAAQGDNIGLICGAAARPAKIVMLALDATEKTAAEAAGRNASLLLTHHPLIYRPVYRICDSDPRERAIRILIENNIACAAAHTNLDAAQGGVNDCLAKKIGLSDIKTYPCEEDACVDSPLCRIGNTDREYDLKSYCRVVAGMLKAGGLRYFDAGSPVCRVAVCGGNGGKLWRDALCAGADTYVTGDGADYNNVIIPALEQGLNIIDAGHYATEAVVLGPFCDRLARAFPDVGFMLSSEETNPYGYIGEF